MEERAGDKKNEQSRQTDRRKEGKHKQKTNRKQQKLFHVNLCHWRILFCVFIMRLLYLKKQNQIKDLLQ